MSREQFAMPGTLKQHRLPGARPFLAMVLLLALSPPAFAGGPEVFGEALAAARDHRWDELTALEQTLGDDHPMGAYLDFHRLVAELPDASPGKVLAYMKRHDDSPLAGDLKARALASYGQHERWAAIRTLTDTPPRALALQCHYHRAWLPKREQQSLDAGRHIWLSGQSRPAACNPLFQALKKADLLDDELVWQRLLLAFRAGNGGLMRYLADELPSGFPAPDRLQALFRDPGRITDLPQEKLTDKHHQQLAAAAAYRLADKDPAAALALLKGSDANALGFQDEAVRARLEKRIAWFMTIRGEQTYRDWRDHWLLRHGNAELLSQRARLAVREQDWTNLPAWVARLDVAEQNKARWQYWLGRAHHEQERTEAGNAAWRKAAGQRSFFGFVAARKLDQPWPLNQQSPDVGREESGQTDNARLARVRWLRAADEPGLAVREWRHALYHADASGHQALADMALAQGWPDLAVIAALHGGSHHVLDWRFPSAFNDNFREAATRFELDPWLLMAVARRESGFQSQARSPAGAVGLMQLMPDTARRMATALQTGAPALEELLRADTSIELGSAYLNYLLERYDGHRLKALAAYNAGPHNVDRWLPEEEPVPFDVWIESITYHETRDYVQAVLAYRLILAALHDDTTSPAELSLLSPGEQALIHPAGDTENTEVRLSQREETQDDTARTP